MIDLKGKCALIVGARRVGQVIAKRLANEGVNLAIGYRSSRDEAESLRQEIAPLVERSCVLQGDLSSEADVTRMIDEAHRQLGGLHFVISLASDFPYNPLGKLDGAAWDRSMAGAKGSYLLALHASRKMRDNPGPTRGHIILFGDTSARETPYRNYLPYLTSKAAVEYMVRAFAVELARYGILVNAIAPGPTIRPPEIEPHEWDEIIEQTTPLKRESSPDDMAEIAVALLRSETITGESVRVDGGNHIAGPYELA